MRARLNSKDFQKKLNNVVDYSFGFLEGAQKGKRVMLDSLGEGVLDALNQYIDAMARSDSAALHHVYEWYQTGSPAARLFDLSYTVSNLGLSVKSSFRQSTSFSKESSRPFYDKARIMEMGISVVISPKKKVLVFNDGGETVFTSAPVTVNDPGGSRVAGSYERVFDSFFTDYFTQAFLKSSGIFDHISKPTLYKKNFASGSKGGRYVGQKVGYAWIANAKMGTQ
jgi:hypothetical protein